MAAGLGELDMELFLAEREDNFYREDWEGFQTNRKPAFSLAWWRCPRLSRDRGLSPQNQVPCSFASRTSGITSVEDAKTVGYLSSFGFTTNDSTSVFANSEVKWAD
jgi:hypothetical protein